MRMKARMPVYMLILLFFACSSDPVFENRESRTPDISIVTIESGSLVSSEGYIPVSLSYSEEYKKRGTSEPLTLEGVLKDPEGEILAVVTFGPEQLTNGTYPSITLPPLEPGYYDLTFTLRDKNGVLSEKTLTFFHDPGTYSLAKISSYPLSFLPGSSGILRAYSRFPEGRNPFIRWTMDGRIIQEFSIADGGDKVFWTAPKKEGVYSVKAELFPFAPKTGDLFSFSSPLMLTSQVFVSGTKRLQETDFAPESVYHSLFHFLGNLVDDGTRTDKREYAEGHLEIIGSPKPDFIQEVFGYALDGDSGFEVKQILLPRLNGRLLPFTLRILLYPRDINSERTIFRVSSDDRSFDFTVFTDAPGSLVLRVESSGTILEKHSGIGLPADKASLVELSLVPEEDKLAVSWTLNGNTVTTSSDPYIFPAVPDSGVSRIAGRNGFIGILDELGIRMDQKAPPGTNSSEPQDSPETEKVLYSLQNGIKDRDADSEGPKLTLQGKVDFENGAAIHPGASLTVGPFVLSGGTYSLSIQSDLFADSNKGEMAIRNAADTPIPPPALLSLQRGGEAVNLFIGEKKIGTMSEKAPILTIKILRFPEHMEIMCLDQSAVITADPDAPVSISVTLSNLPDAKSAAVVQNLVVRQEAEEDPVKRLLDAFGTERKN